MPALPQIAQHGYKLQCVEDFLTEATPEIVARYRRDCIGNGGFIIWDPESDDQGFMLCGRSTAELNKGFMDFFAGDIDF